MAKKMTQWMWEQACAEAQAYFAAHNDLDVPEEYETESGFPLGAWIEDQRLRHRWGRLGEDQVKRLNSLHMLWNKYEVRWERSFRAVAQYGKLFGNLQIPKGYSTPETGDLFAWLANQRQKYKNGELSQERADRLEALGVCWEPHLDKWEQMFAEAKRYYEVHGNLKVPIPYKTESGLGLGKWIYDQRKARREAQEGGRPYAPERVRRLDEIGMNWNGQRTRKHEINTTRPSGASSSVG